MKPGSWSKSPAEIENEIRMQRKLHAGSFLIIEGDDDHRFWRPRVAADLCELVIGDGKPNVVSAIGRLDDLPMTGALGIVDGDFDRLQGVQPQSQNLIATDEHDLECSLLRSSALERVLAELGDAGKIRRFEQRGQTSVRAALLQRGLLFGRLRWLALRQGGSQSFDALKPSQRFVDERSWEVNEQALHAAAVKTAICDRPETLGHLLSSLPDADPWCICQGHDLIELLKLGLRQVLGSLKASKGAAEIAALLRQAHDDRELHSGHLGRSIRRWESRNSPYRVLPVSAG